MVGAGFGKFLQDIKPKDWSISLDVSPQRKENLQSKVKDLCDAFEKNNRPVLYKCKRCNEWFKTITKARNHVLKVHKELIDSSAVFGRASHEKKIAESYVEKLSKEFFNDLLKMLKNQDRRAFLT